MQTFEAVQREFPKYSQLIDQIKTYFNNKYWFQFGEALLTLTSAPEIKASDHVLKIFEMVFDNPTVNIDKVAMAVLATRAVDRISSIEDKLKFFSKVEEFTKAPKARLLLLSHKALVLTIADKKTEALELLRSIKPEIDTLHNADKIIFSTFFKSMAIYHLKESDFQKFYTYSLQYLAYTSEGELSDAEKEDIAVNMAVAILVSEKIFNFSELLEQRAFQSLQQNPTYSWLFTLMETFNSGDVLKFQKDIKQFAQQIESLPNLAQRKNILEDKIKIMAFAELIFTLPKNERTVSFEQIAKVTGIKENMIELMIIKAMSLDLLKGSIDEVGQVVTVSWIQPRVLNRERIATMKNKFTNWLTSLGELQTFVETYKDSL